MLKKYRIENNIRITYLVNKFNIDSKTYYKYENDINIMPITFLIEFSDYYKLSINYLLNYQLNKRDILIQPIKTIRLKRCLSQVYIQNTTGINRRVISNIENGKRTIKVFELLILSELYNLDPETLIKCIYC